MSSLIDSDHLIDALIGRPETIAFLDYLGERGAAICISQSVKSSRAHT